MHMIRKQVYLTEELDQAIRIAAQREGKAEAQVIRESLSRGLEQQNADMPTIGAALGSLIELGKRLDMKLPPDLSTNIDKYLYEDQ
jgi:plasmid stability protein